MPRTPCARASKDSDLSPLAQSQQCPSPEAPLPGRCPQPGVGGYRPCRLQPRADGRTRTPDPSSGGGRRPAEGAKPQNRRRWPRKRPRRPAADPPAGLRPVGGASNGVLASGYARSTVYEWREADGDFAARWDESIDIAVELMEAEADRRGVEGVDEPLTYKGEIYGYVRRYSDTC
jgi:hypothetical protein